MGASGWKYFVPYQADIGKAFMELRAEVFARGEQKIGSIPAVRGLQEDIEGDSACGGHPSTLVHARPVAP